MMNLISKEGNLVRNIFGGGMGLEFTSAVPVTARDHFNSDILNIQLY